MRDTWIVGQGADSDSDYLVHLDRPRFICRFDDSGEEPPAAVLGGLSVSVSDTVFWAVEWLDAPPSDEAGVLALFQRAVEALDRHAFRPHPEEDDDDESDG